MNTAWFNNACCMTHILAEDVGAPELRNPMNSGLRADTQSSRLIRKLAAWKKIFTLVFY